MSKSVLCLLMICFVACTSVPYQESGLAKVQIGMDKGNVLGLVGNPDRTYRQNSEDHWIYEYSKEGQHFERQVVFQKGLVREIGPLYEKKAVISAPAAEDSETIEQFEKKLKDETPAKPKGEFKDVE